MVYMVWRATVCKILSLHARVFIQKDVGRQLEHMLVACVFVLRGEKAGAGKTRANLAGSRHPAGMAGFLAIDDQFPSENIPRSRAGIL